MTSDRNGDRERFGQAELILAGHGSANRADSWQPVHQHAEELRRRNLFVRVTAAFSKQEPFLKDVWGQAHRGEVFVVPLMIGAGYFWTEVFPRELGLRDRCNPAFGCAHMLEGRVIRYSPPIGTHDRMTDVLLARAQSLLPTNPKSNPPDPGRTALIIAGHGTPRSTGSRQSVDWHVERIRALGIFAEVHAAFLEEEPRISKISRIARAPSIVVVPFFISDGLHVREHIPVMLGESEPLVRARCCRGEPVWVNPTRREGRWIWYTASVGTEPLLAEVILSRVREVATVSVDAPCEPVAPTSNVVPRPGQAQR